MDDQPRPLTPAAKRKLWALLEDMDADLGDVLSDMPRGQLKSTLEDALGRLASAQWALARDLGGKKRDEPAEADLEAAEPAEDAWSRPERWNQLWKAAVSAQNGQLHS